MADKIVSWGGFDSKSTSGMGITGSLGILNTNTSSSVLLDIVGSTNNSLTFISNPVLSGQQQNGLKVNISTAGYDPNGSHIAYNFQVGGTSYFTIANYGLATFAQSISTKGMLIQGNTSSTTSLIVYAQGAASNAIETGGSEGTVHLGSNTVNTKINEILRITGKGTTSSTTAFRVQNANTSASLSVRDDGLVSVGSNLNFGSVSNYIYWGDANQRIEGGSNFYNYSGNWSFVRSSDSTTLMLLGSGNNIYFRGTVRGLANETLTITGGSIGGTRGYDLIVKGTNATTQPQYVGGNAGDLILENGLATDNSQGRGGIPGSIIFKYGVYNNTASVEYGRINSSGSFLIGTSTGSATLLISGSSNSTLFEIDSPAANNIIYVSGSGNVGIGTGTPANTLDVRSAAASTGVDKYTGFTTRIQNTKDGDSVNAVLLLVNQNGGGGGYYIRGLNNQQGQERFYVNGNGSVWSIGNGTFLGNVYTTQIRWNTDSDGWIGDGGLDGTFMVVTNGIERYRVTPNGSLLLGTTTDSARLLVKGSGTTSSTTALLVQNANASGSLSVKDDGSVGIGTASPLSSGLTVANSAYSGYGRMYMNANNTLIISDNGTGGNITFGPSNRIFVNTPQLAITNGFISIGNGIAISANSYPYGSTFTLNNYFANNIGASTGLTISSNYVRNGAGGPNTGTAVRITDTNINTSAGVTNAITMLTVDPSVNTTGGATTLRGIYYNPAMTSSVGLTQHTAIETTTGSVIFNGGNVGIGTSTPSSSLHISGASAVLTLTPQSPLPSGVPTGSFAVSSSVPPKPYFYDGTVWNALY